MNAIWRRTGVTSTCVTLPAGRDCPAATRLSSPTRPVLSRDAGRVLRAAAGAPREKRLDFLPRGDVRQAWACTKRFLVNVVEGAEAARKELTINHPLGKSVYNRNPSCCASSLTPSPTNRLFRDPSIDKRFRTTTQSIILPSTMRRLTSRLAHHLCVMACTCHGERLGVDAGQHVEIDETVIDWRHQRVGHRMRQAGQVGSLSPAYRSRENRAYARWR